MSYRPTYADDVTDEMITALRAEAYAAGDDRMVITCDRALAGDDHSRELVASAIDAARAMEDT